MRLQRESGLHEDTVEYRTAVKSVIRCQIQSLLQKLALETGEESILISTNVAAGTYNHLGSHLGREYLEDGDEYVQVICEKFTSYCAENHNHESSTDSFTQKGVSSAEKSDTPKHRSLPAPKRKRQLNAEDTNTTPLKRKPPCLLEDDSTYTPRNSFQGECSPGLVDDSPEQTSSPSLDKNQIDKENETPRLSWIKVEPNDGETSGNHSILNESAISPCSNVSSKVAENYSLDDDPSQTSIVNRPKSLIPLANIYRKYGANKQIKSESPPQDESKSLSEKSILRSLYEQPLYKEREPDEDGETSGKGTEIGNQLEVPALNLPSSIDDESFTASSENLVLSGYYDSDSYPMYRHKQKHPVNNQNQKKSTRVRDKGTALDITPDILGTENQMRTFESGGRLVYACDVCNRELSHLTSYRRHMKLHTMERPHKCPVCSKGFIRKYHCIDHLNKHHKGVGFDPDTLKLTGALNISKESEENTASALSSSNEQQDEYNYTLDQSIMDNSENDLSLNASQLDQSASAMLSELAKSAAKSQMSVLNLSMESDTNPTGENHDPEDKPGQVLWMGRQGCHDNGESEEAGITCQHSSEIPSLSNKSVENGKVDDSPSLLEEKSDCPSIEHESTAEMRKNEVSKGIKAIVEHLKTSSRNKRKRVPPKALTTDMVN